VKTLESGATLGTVLAAATVLVLAALAAAGSVAAAVPGHAWGFGCW
jgi:hypothetical protein